MALTSHLLSASPRLQSCLTSDPAHVVPGDKGDYVWRIQIALGAIDRLKISPEEIATQSYGPSTAAAVLAFKTKRAIINRSYQTKPDNIVGKMTVAALDAELLKLESPVRPGLSRPTPSFVRPKGIAEMKAEAMVRVKLALPQMPIARPLAAKPPLPRLKPMVGMFNRR